MRTLLLSLLLAVSCHAFTKEGSTGRTIKTNGSLADVQAAIDAAPNDGSATVIIPKGTFRWTGTLSINKSLALAGDEGSVIENNNGPYAVMINAVSPASGNINIYGLKVIQVVANGGSSSGGQLSCDRTEPSNYTVLIHDCVFDTKDYFSYAIWARANGIIFWNDSFPGTGGERTNNLTGISFTCSKYGYTSSWNTPSTYGNADTTGLANSYIEDCSFSNGPSFSCNADDNARVVYRHCVFTDAIFGGHGQDSAQYGARQAEIYDNKFVLTGNNIYMNNWITFRGGAGVIFGNSMPDIPNKPRIVLTLLSINRPGSTQCQTAYPAARQVAQGWSASSNAKFGNPVVPEDGTGAVIEGVYVWGNTGGEGDPNRVDLSQYVPDDCGNGQKITNYLKEGRDYFVGKPKPGYTPYVYPHPLHVAYGGGNPNPTPTPTPQPTPTPPEPTPTPAPTPGQYKTIITITSGSPISVDVKPDQQ